MKIFNTLQELWGHCRFCPICQDLTREVTVSVGPDDVFVIENYSKEDQFLNLNCVFKSNSLAYNVHYVINCLNNTFEVSFSLAKNNNKKVYKAKKPYFYFYIQSHCDKCLDTTAMGSDIEFNIQKKKISNIGLEVEDIIIRGKTSGFQLYFEYDENKLEITPFKNNDSLDIPQNPINFPILDFDFSKLDKVINKIKTLIVFS